MMKTQHASVYTDFNGLNKLKSAAAKDTPEARRETAQQFEAMFLQMMLKTMRQASEGDELLGGSQVEMSRDMYDKQLSIELSKNGAIGIGDLMLKQMSDLPDASVTETEKSFPQTVSNSLQNPARPSDFTARLMGGEDSTTKTPYSLDWKTPEDFIRQLKPAAENAAQKLGAKTEAVLAIAALETGWGQHIIPTPDGTSSNNLFGVKADQDWNQNQVIATTLEFEDGIMHKRREPFRQYSSAQESMQDFADFLTQNPRYEKALSEADNPQRFIKELHKAGYATDPEYAQKVLSVMDKVNAMTQEVVMVADK